MHDFLGKVAPGYGADFFLVPKLHADPYVSLLETQPKDISLVFVEGFPIYGNAEHMKKLVLPTAVDEIEVQGTRKGIVTLGDPMATPHYNEHYQEIETALKRALPKLAPLIEQ